MMLVQTETGCQLTLSAHRQSGLERCPTMSMGVEPVADQDVRVEPRKVLDRSIQLENIKIGHWASFRPVLRGGLEARRPHLVTSSGSGQHSQAVGDLGVEDEVVDAV